jgi:hypothetical protein
MRHEDGALEGFASLNPAPAAGAGFNDAKPKNKNGFN